MVRASSVALRAKEGSEGEGEQRIMDLVKVGQCKAVFGTYDVYSVTGFIHSSSTRNEMEVSSSPSFIGGEGAMDVRSATTWYQTLIVTDDDGREHAIELTNLMIPCRDGHRITVWSLGRGQWFKAYNHNTRQSITRHDLEKCVFPKFFMGGLFGVSLVVILIGGIRILDDSLASLLLPMLAAAAFFAAYGIAKIISLIRASIIRKTPLAST